MKPSARITDTRVADANNVVHTIHGGGKGYCKTPCEQCPWRVDQTGSFPAEAFRLSALTAYDMAQNVFACHMAGAENPKTCAGFLLRGGDDNLAVRMGRAGGRYMDVEDGGHELHESYRAMSVANGVDPSDPILRDCMPEARDNPHRR